MQSVELSVYIAAPDAAVFERVSDHERFFVGHGIRSCRVTRPGSPSRNGLGALREVHTSGLRFVEDITHFEPNRRLDYLVRQCTVPLRHDGGRVDFVAHGGGTEVRWRSTFRLAVPFGASAAEDLFAMALTTTITRLLIRVKHDLEARPTA